MKQETLEEATSKWSLEKAQLFALSKFEKKGISTKGTVNWESILEVLKVGVLTGHKFGAKWQQERSYSEEDMKTAFFSGGDMREIEEFNFWFKKFKKK